MATLEEEKGAAEAAIAETEALIAALEKEIETAERVARANAEVVAKVDAELPGLIARADAVLARVPTVIAQGDNRKNIAAIRADADALKAAVDAVADADDATKATQKKRISDALDTKLADAQSQGNAIVSESGKVYRAVRKVKDALVAVAAALASGDTAKAAAAISDAETYLAAARAANDAATLQIVKDEYGPKLDAHEKALSDARDDLAKLQAAMQSGSLPPLPSAVFPDSITPEGIEAATIKRNIGGTTGARLVEIDGVKYICKTTGGGQGVSAEHVRNEADADQAYRRAGIRVPDCRVYEVNGKTYKLSQFIEGGTSLGDWMKKASPAQKDAMRAELAQGYALDALFANWDVLGTAQDNVLVDKDGHAWRIDNGSAFGFRAQGAKKTPEQWENREWPDEWRSLRTSGINKGVYDGLTAHDIFHAFNQLDVDAAVQGLPADTQKALAKPLAEMKQLGARCADFDRGGILPVHTTAILEHTYNLSKERFRDEVPSRISQGNFGFCRSSSGGASSVPQSAFQAEFNAIKQAAISINHHIGTGDYAANQNTVSKALANKAKLQAAAATDPDAKQLLGFISQIEASQSGGFKTKIGMVALPQKTASAGASKYKSLTDHLYDYAANRAEKDPGGNPVPIDVERIADCFRSQGGSSWNHEAVRLKLLTAAMRGKSWNPPPYDSDIWYGTKSGKETSDWRAIADEYKRDPALMQRDIKALRLWKSATTLLLENADFAGNDRSSHTVFVVRNEDADVVKGLQKDVLSPAYAMGTEESFSVFSSVTPTGGRSTTMREVPYSRVQSVYFMEPKPGVGGSRPMFLGDKENEIGIDATDLPVMYVGALGYGVHPTDHKAKWDAAMSKNPTLSAAVRLL